MTFTLTWARSTSALRALYEHGPHFDTANRGMYECCRVMAKYGMVFDIPSPRGPEPSDFGITEPVVPPGESDDPTVSDFWEAMDDWRRRQWPIPGIPLYKLSTNDLWLVTPREIAGALEAYFDSEIEPEDEPLLEDLITFFIGAMLCGGFIVS